MKFPSRIWKSTRHIFCSIVVLTAGAGVVPASIIDDFSQGPVTLLVTNLNGQTLVQNGLSTTAVIGGSRSIYAGSQNQATASVITGTGQFHFSADADFGYFTLQYGSLASPLGADLKAGGNDRFEMSIAVLTPGLFRGGFDFNIESGGTWYTSSFSQSLFALNAPGVLSIPFARFPGADMTQVQAIQVEVFRFEPGFQITLDSITSIPEPSALGLISLGLLCGRRFIRSNFARRQTLR